MNYQIVLFTDDVGPGEVIAEVYDIEDGVLLADAKAENIRKLWRKRGLYLIKTEQNDLGDEYEVLVTDSLNNLLAALYVEPIDYAMDD